MTMVRMTGVAGAVCALAVAGLAVASAAQGPKAAADGVYTEAQAARGQEAYTRACASCHMPDLRGESFAPPLAEDAFASRWSGKSVGELYVILQGTMPMDSPASMKPEEYADLVAFLLKKNGYPAAMDELKADPAALKLVKFKS